jgi:hypothetical protein
VRSAAADLGATPVRASVTGDVRSGTLSDVSLPPFTLRQPVAGTGTVTDVSAGTVTRDNASTQGERLTQPVRDLAALQEQMRAINPLPRDQLPADAIGSDSETAPLSESAIDTDAGDGDDRVAYTDDEATDQLELQKQHWYGQGQQPGAQEVVQPPPPQVEGIEPQDQPAPRMEQREDNIDSPPPVNVPEAEP